MPLDVMTKVRGGIKTYTQCDTQNWQDAKMNGVWLKVVANFTEYPVFAQVVSFTFSWLFLFFTVDAWFSPFYLTGYQLILYNLIVLALSAWITHVNVCKLILSPTPISCFNEEQQLKPHSLPLLSLKDICEAELSNVAKHVSDLTVEYLSDGSDDNQEFVKEIQNHIQDVFCSLTGKLSNINVESFAKNIILIMHNHVRNHLGTQTIHSSRHSKYPFLHPVTTGELSLDAYLDYLSHAILKELIPGSIQDCSAIFDLTCAAFSSQVLVKFIESLSQPEVILESLVQFCETDDFVANNCDKNTVMPIENSSKYSEKKFPEDGQNLDKKSEMSIPAKEKFLNENNASTFLGNANFLIDANQLNESSYVQTGLSCTIPAATAPLLASHASAESNQSPTNAVRKPDSLPLRAAEEKNSSCDSSSPPVPLSLEGDISPVYEDVEDFPSAIAKLRSFLEQRNASTGSESAGSKGSSFSASCDNTRTGSSGAETEGSFEELFEASEQQLDSRIFLNIKIPRTEVCSVPNEGQHSVFCISYDGIYTALSTNTDDCHRESRLVLKSRTVRRRFRQFLELHGKLTKSEDPNVSQAIRSIRGPSKWLNLPFSRLDQNTVAHRQGFLERYLQELVASPSLGISNELRQFLEYELHLNENNSAPSSAALQRVPFFAKTMSDVLQSIKTAIPLTIPGFDNDLSRGVQLVPLPPPTPHSVTFDSSAEFKSIQPSLADDLDTDATVACRTAYSTEKSKLEQMLCDWSEKFCRTEPAFEALESDCSQSIASEQCFEDVNTAGNDFYNSCLSLDETLKEVRKDDWDRFDDDLPLSSSVINLAVECLSVRGTWLTRAPVPLVVKVLFGQRIEAFLQETLSNLANPDQLSESIHQLQHKIRNGTPVDQSKEKQTIKELVGKIVCHLETKLPRFAVWILGKQLCIDVLRSTVSCFTDPHLNRDLALTLIDFLFSHLYQLFVTKTRV